MWEVGSAWLGAAPTSISGVPVLVLVLVLGYIAYYLRRLEVRLAEASSTSAPAPGLVREASGDDAQKLMQLELLMYMHDAVSNDREVDGIIQRITKVAATVIDAESICVFLLSKDRRTLMTVHSPPSTLEIDASTGIEGFVAQTGQTVNTKDASTDPRHSPRRVTDVDGSMSFKSLLCCAIFSHDEIVGVIRAVNKRDKARALVSFTKTDEHMLKYVASNAGIALKKAQLYAQAIRAKRVSDILLSIVRMRATEASLEELIQFTIEAAYQLLLPERVSLFLVDHVRNELWIGVSKDGLKGITIPLGKGLAGSCAAFGQIINVPDAHADSRFNPDIDIKTGYRTRSVLCAPVPGFANNGEERHFEKPLAVLQLINKTDNRPFDKDDEDALQAFCQEVSMALRRKLLETSMLKCMTDAQMRPDESPRAVFETSLLQEYGSKCDGSKYRAQVVVKHLTQQRIEKKASVFDLLTPGLRSEESIARQLDLIEHWNFDPFTESEETLATLAFEMIRNFDLVSRCNLDKDRLKSFLTAVCEGYNNPHFHNFRHGFSVMHITYLILSKGGAAEYLGPVEILSALVAAICHDLNHPGHNNAFEINSRSELALLYSDDAVLERHHAHQTYKLLTDPQYLFYGELADDEKGRMRKKVFDAILGTDMALHFNHVNFLDSRSKMSGSRDDPAHRVHLISAIVHCADLSGQTMDPVTAWNWGSRCIDEFRSQARKERDMGLPVTAFMDNLDDERNQLNLQLNFVTTIVQPLWTALVACLPKLATAVDGERSVLHNIEANLVSYRERIQQLSSTPNP